MDCNILKISTHVDIFFINAPIQTEKSECYHYEDYLEIKKQNLNDNCYGRKRGAKRPNTFIVPYKSQTNTNPE